MQATQYALGRAAVVILNKGDIQARDIGEVVGVEGLEEKATTVTKDLGLQDENAWQRSRYRVEGHGAYFNKDKRYWP